MAFLTKMWVADAPAAIYLYIAFLFCSFSLSHSLSRSLSLSLSVALSFSHSLTVSVNLPANVCSSFSSTLMTSTTLGTPMLLVVLGAVPSSFCEGGREGKEERATRSATDSQDGFEPKLNGRDSSWSVVKTSCRGCWGFFSQSGFCSMVAWLNLTSTHDLSFNGGHHLFLFRAFYLAP